MLTSRGWWLLLSATAVLAAGLVLRLPLLSLCGLALLLWFFWEGLLFAVRVSSISRGLSVRRGLHDSSDADMLGRLTHVPGGMWAGLFWLLAGVAVITAVWVLLF